MQKPKIMGGYDTVVTEGCERVLVTLLRGLGTWKNSIVLVGGLTPRYLVAARPPEIPQHAGTSDVDVVVDIGMLADVDAYATLADNLLGMKFTRVVNDKGHEVSWQWETEVEGGAKMRLEFLADFADDKSRVKSLPTDSKVTAANIRHASIVFDLHDTKEITAQLLDGGGRATEVVRHADIVSFTCLKSFAYHDRNEPKDAHDLVYCIEHHPAGDNAVRAAFHAAMEGPHGDVIRQALDLLARHFRDPNPEESYLRDGPVAVARFEDNAADVQADEELRNRRILRQRQVADVVNAFLDSLR